MRQAPPRGSPYVDKKGRWHERETGAFTGEPPPYYRKITYRKRLPQGRDKQGRFKRVKHRRVTYWKKWDWNREQWKRSDPPRPGERRRDRLGRDRVDGIMVPREQKFRTYRVPPKFKDLANVSLALDRQIGEENWKWGERVEYMTPARLARLKPDAFYNVHVEYDDVEVRELFFSASALGMDSEIWEAACKLLEKGLRKHKVNYIGGLHAGYVIAYVDLYRVFTYDVRLRGSAVPALVDKIERDGIRYLTWKISEAGNEPRARKKAAERPGRRRRRV
jgi:hypothetical protein